MEPTAGGAGDIREYLTVLKTRKWTLILTVLLVLGGVIAFSLQQTKQYTSEAKVLVEPLDSDATISPLIPVDLDTQEQVVSSHAVAALVRSDLDSDLAIEDLLDGLSVAGIAESQVLQITYTAEDPEVAQATADSFATSYLTYRLESSLEETRAEQEVIEGRVSGTSQQLSRVNDQLKDAEQAEDDALVSNLETQRNVLIARLGVLQQRLDDLRTASASSRGVGEVIEPALLPTSPSSPNLMLNGILGLLVGLGLGIALAILRERLDDRFRGREDLERSMGVPVLATVPRFRTDRKDLPASLVAAHSPSSVASEAYRSLRTNLQFIASQRDLKSVVLTSSSAGEGKSVTTANLGTVLAQAGRRVILVSTDLRRPTLGKYFSIAEPSNEGLSTWLTGRENDISSLVRDPGIPNLRIVPSGPIPPNPAELLSSPRFRNFIRILEDNCDIVLLDSPPVLAVADAAILASQAGGIMLIVDATSTHRSAIVAAKSDLSKVGGRLIGAVVNAHDATDSPYYYAQYEYGHETQSNGGKRAAKKAKKAGKLRRSSTS